jgi:hypothetical protein
MNTEIFRNRFKKHDAAIKELTKELTNKIVEEIMEEIVGPKISSRTKRNYQEAFAQKPPYTRFSDELYDDLQKK